MRTNAKKVLNFLTNNFDFIKLLFDLCKEDSAIKTEELIKLCNEHSVSTVVLITDLRILRELPNGNYKLHKNYSDFLQFLFDEYAISLPEALAAMSNAIEDIFAKLQKATDKSQTITYITGLNNIIDDFLERIDRYTQNLLRDTESLKSSAESSTDLTLRIKKATFWIDEFIKPLNAILDKSQTKSIINTISLISAYANLRKFEEEDSNLRGQFAKLYLNALNADLDINQQIKKLTRELLPLLDRIKTNSQIQMGFYYFLDNFNNPEGYIVPLPNLAFASRYSTYSIIFDKEAAMFLEHFKEPIKTFIENEEPEIDQWLPDTEFFKDKLRNSLPVENFYEWCYQVLKDEEIKPNMMKYATISNLIFEREFDADFESTERLTLELEDVILTVPKVNLYANVSGRT
jgi:hypothetical protein